MHRGKYQKRKPRRKSKVTIKLCLLLFFGGVFIISAIIAGSIMLEQKAARDAYSDIRQQTQSYTSVTSSIKNATGSENTDTQIPPITEDSQRTVTLDFAPLKEINTEIVAWLFAEGTPIDYPVLHTDNNSYYLNHLYTGESNKSGSLFLDYRNTGLFTERNTVIYGHYMNDDTMFGSLKLYKEQDFYEEHPTMLLCTPEGDYLIELICGTVEDGNYEFVQFEFADEDAFTEYVDAQRSRSTFQSNVELSPGDRIISLCTCSYEWNNARYMIIGRLVPLYQTQDIT